MAIFTTPRSFRLASGNGFSAQPTRRSYTEMALGALSHQSTIMGHEAHPPMGHLILLVFEAVMEVVCVAFPGYIIARQGHFDAESQKFVANLNVMLFTPCLSVYYHHRISWQGG